MTDRELIEMAAKAAGCEVLEVFDGGNLHIKGPGIHKVGWNPLTDDGDALRLAVRLGMEVYIDNHPEGCQCVEVESHTHKVGRFFQMLRSHADYESATRCAIVACAAEIGRNMP